MQEVTTAQQDVEQRGLRRALSLHGRTILLGMALAVGILGAAIFLPFPGSVEGESRPLSLSGLALGPVPEVGKPAPDLQVPGFAGESLRLSDFLGRPVWLNFWATWCPPCRAENPDIEATYQEFREQGLVVLAVSVAESPATVREYAQKVGLSYTIGLDTSRFAAARYRVLGLPTHVFIDRQGVIREYRVGGLSRESMRALVQEILPQP